jgi:hypothetical protein
MKTTYEESTRGAGEAGSARRLSPQSASRRDFMAGAAAIGVALLFPK